MLGLLGTSTTAHAVQLGSLGYENHKDVENFAALIADSGMERLIDVRELPISRRRGFAKTALSNALADHGVEYLHLRSMGNPKEFRDLYKSGRAAEGETAFRKLLLAERMEALLDLASLVQEKRSALMCWEHDERVCHRRVILEALESEADLTLDIVHI